MQALEHARPDPIGRYGRIELAGRVESATPHALVTLLLDELGVAILRVRRALEQHRPAAALPRALDIVQALRMGLDHERGGELAATLAAVYETVHRHLLDGVRERAPGRVASAGSMIADISDAWKQIAAD